MKNIIVNRKTIALMLLTVFLVFGVQGTSHGFFGDIIDAIGDIIGFVGDIVGLVVDVVAGTVKLAAGIFDFSIEIASTFLWPIGSLFDIVPFPDGGLLGVVVSDIIHLWDPLTEQTTATLTHTADILDIAFSPDGLLLASASVDNTVQLWNLNTEKIQNVLQGHTADVLSVAFSPDGSLLASASADNTIRLWNAQTETLLATLTGHTADVLSVVFSPDGSLLASASIDDTVRLWDVHAEQLQATLDHQAPVLSIDFSPDGLVLATGSEDGTARLWDPETQKIIATLGHESPVKNIAFSPDGSMLFTGTADGKTRQWEITTSTNQPASTPATSRSTIVQIQPASVASPVIGGTLTLNLDVAGGEAVAGYQATVQFDTTALRYVSSANGDYLPAGAFFATPIITGNLVKLNAASLTGDISGNGTLATLTYEVIAAKASTVTLSDVLLVSSTGASIRPQIENGAITEPTGIKGDVNGDGIVNIIDLLLVASNIDQTGQNSADINGDGIVNIVDLVLVAGQLGNAAAAPSLHRQSLETLTATDIKFWLSQAQHLPLTDATSVKGILFLEQLLAALTPKETALLPNYPNPFNPETWIPYQLAKNADITLTIYAVDGQVVRTLALGHQPAGIYQNRSRAAYWDGKNEFGEPVASGVYFYTLTADDFTATRKMLIRK